MAWTNEAWTPDRENIPPRPSPTAADVLEHKDLLDKWFVDGNAVVRFTSPLDAGYKVQQHSTEYYTTLTWLSGWLVGWLS